MAATSLPPRAASGIVHDRYARSRPVAQGGVTGGNIAIGGEVTAVALRAKVGDALRPIRVGPGLLVYLDRAKRQIFLKRWRRALQGR